MSLNQRLPKSSSMVLMEGRTMSTSVEAMRSKRLPTTASSPSRPSAAVPKRSIARLRTSPPRMTDAIAWITDAPTAAARYKKRKVGGVAYHRQWGGYGASLPSFGGNAGGQSDLVLSTIISVVGCASSIKYSKVSRLQHASDGQAGLRCLWQSPFIKTRLPIKSSGRFLPWVQA